MARDLLDRFFREAEGKTNRQIDVYFTLEDMGIVRDKADEALEFLTSRGLVNMFGPDIAFLTDLGATAIAEERDLAKMPKAVREFAVKPGGPAPVLTPPPASPEPAIEDRAPPPSIRPPHPERPRLTFTDADGRAHVVELGATCSIGRVEGNTIHLADQRASKKHAELRYENGHYLLKDLGAANGTLVNGAYIDTHTLVHGDSILIGRTTLTFEAPLVIPPPREVKGPDVEPRPQVIVPPITVEQPRPQPANLSPSIQGIKVVKGKPDEAPRPKRETRGPEPEGDLFDTVRPQSAPPVAQGSKIPPFPRGPEDPHDLFAQPARAKDPGADDLFGSEPSARRARSEGDLFADASPKGRKSAPARGGDDLFAEPAAPARSSARPAPFEEPPRSASPSIFDEEEPPRAQLDAHPKARMSAIPGLDDLPIDEMEPVDASMLGHDTLDPLAEPVRPSASIAADEDVDLEATMIRRAPREAAPVEEPWAERTPADVAATGDMEVLENQPVVDEMPELAPTDFEDVAATPAATQAAIQDTLVGEADTALALDRDALVADVTPPSVRPVEPTEELARWGDDRAPLMGSHPPFGGRPFDAPAGEDLPEASISLADATPVALERGPDTPFHRTLRSLHGLVERADLPDRAALLGALELLEQHPYVRAALARLEHER